MKRISIITVVKNASGTIEKTLKSVIEQKSDKVEYIVIDGLSTDGTFEIIKTYSKKIDIIISEKDEGLYDAMNKGIRMASGNIIGLLNAGDVYTKGLLKKVINLAQAQHYNSIIHGNMLIIDPLKGDIRKILEYSGNIYNLTKNCCIAHPTAFVPKWVYNKIGTYDIKFKLVADYDFFVRAILKSKIKEFHVNEIFVEFEEGGLSNNTLKCILENHKVREKNEYSSLQSTFTTFQLLVKFYLKKLLKANKW